MTGHYRKASGFTLLEMLAATALVAMLAGSLYVSLGIAFRARRSALCAVEFARKADLTMDLLAADLRSAVVPNGVLAGPVLGQDAKGDRGHDADTLVIYCTGSRLEPTQGVGDIRKVEIACEPSDDGKTQLLVRQITFNLLAPRTPEPTREVLCRGVFAFNLRYYDGTDWLDTWDSTAENNALPCAVEVTLQLDGDRPIDVDGGGYKATQVFVIPCGVAQTDTTTGTGATTGTGTTAAAQTGKASS